MHSRNCFAQRRKSDSAVAAFSPPPRASYHVGLAEAPRNYQRQRARDPPTIALAGSTYRPVRTVNAAGKSSGRQARHAGRQTGMQAERRQPITIPPLKVRLRPLPGRLLTVKIARRATAVFMGSLRGKYALVARCTADGGAKIQGGRGSRSTG